VPSIGDLVRLESTRVGQAPRDGVVTGVDGGLLRIEWSTGEESSLIPGAGSVTIVGKARNSPGKKAAKSAAKRAPARKAAKRTTKKAAKRAPARKAAKRTTKKNATGKRAPARKAAKRTTKKRASPR
jgi:hypothetical protein